LNASVENLNWVELYRATLSELDTQQRLSKIELAERNIKQRMRDLTIAGPESTGERQRLNHALENLRGLREGSQS